MLIIIFGLLCILVIGLVVIFQWESYSPYPGYWQERASAEWARAHEEYMKSLAKYDAQQTQYRPIRISNIRLDQNDHRPTN